MNSCCLCLTNFGHAYNFYLRRLENKRYSWPLKLFQSIDVVLLFSSDICYFLPCKQRSLACHGYVRNLCSQGSYFLHDWTQLNFGSNSSCHFGRMSRKACVTQCQVFIVINMTSAWQVWHGVPAPVFCVWLHFLVLNPPESFTEWVSHNNYYLLFLSHLLFYHYS